MTLEEFIERADREYEHMVRDLWEKYPLSVSKIEEKYKSNENVYNTVYFQDYLRYRSLTMLSVYHDYLREQLIKTAGVDIGDFLGLE